MAATNSPVSAPQLRTVVLTRIYDAPRERVFKAWTDPKQMARWWGPKGFTNPVRELDVRPCGAIRIDMAGPDGTVYPMVGVFHGIVAPERLQGWRRGGARAWCGSAISSRSGDVTQAVA